MPEFKHQPTVPFLQALVKTSLIDSLDNLNKAVRLWYTLNQFGSEFQPGEFTDRQWREHLYPHDNGRDQKPDLIEGSIANKGIGEILFDQQDKWDEWKQSFVEFHSGLNGRGKSQAELLELLALIEQQKPFYVTGKTILNHLQTLESLGYLEFVDARLSKSKFKLVDEFPVAPVGSPTLQLSEVVKIEDSECLSEDFSSYTHLFSQRIKDVQRFYINADYRTLDTEKLEITSLHQKVLKEIWEREIIPLVKLKYHSASQNRSYTAIVSPVCIYYHQRAFYLCGFGVCGAETQSSWHNYRIDRIEKIEELENSRDDLPQDLQVQGERANQQKLIEEIENRLTDAYGFDFYRDQKTMLLRFDRDFHDRYIANTWRHHSFKQITPSTEEIDPLIKGSNLANNELLKKRIAAHPNDAYYTMNYRKGDNSVIMRLRAWCPNVEVLFPFDLRDRMREDMEKTWGLYKDDE